MIQRIQSLYLILIIALMILMFLFPLAEFLINEQFYSFYHNGVKNSNVFLYHTYPQTILIVVITLFSVITIFLYKNRNFQMRLCRLNMMLLLGLLILLGFYIYKFIQSENAIWSFSVFSIVPIITIILYYLAYKGIKKDDNLVKSIDRIR